MWSCLKSRLQNTCVDFFKICYFITVLIKLCTVLYFVVAEILQFLQCFCFQDLCNNLIRIFVHTNTDKFPFNFSKYTLSLYSVSMLLQYLFCPRGCWEAESPAWWADPWSPHRLLVSRTPCYRGEAPSCLLLLLCKTHLCPYHHKPDRYRSKTGMFKASLNSFCVPEGQNIFLEDTPSSRKIFWKTELLRLLRFYLFLLRYCFTLL